MPMASNPRPVAEAVRGLELPLPMHPRAAAWRCVVAVGRSERVALRVEYLARDGYVLDALTARMGVTLWRQLVLPAIRTHADALGLPCEVCEVLSLGQQPPPPPRRERRPDNLRTPLEE